MKRALTSPLGFVALAVALTVAIASALSHDPAAPSAKPATERFKVRDPGVSAQEAADSAVGVAGVAGTLYPLEARVFVKPIASYRRYAERLGTRLDRQVTALAAALRAGDRARARRLRASADSSFSRMGAAYGALGDLGDRLAAGLEHGAPASRLERDVTVLRRRLPTVAITPLTYATRAHEILEDVQRDRLDSSAGVRATADGLAATRVVLHTLAPVLSGRGDALFQSRVWLRRLGTTLASIRHAHGGTYPTVGGLTMRERERLNGRLGATLGALSGIPSELETAKRTPVPRIPG